MKVQFKKIWIGLRKLIQEDKELLSKTGSYCHTWTWMGRERCYRSPGGGGKGELPEPWWTICLKGAVALVKEPNYCQSSSWQGRNRWDKHLIFFPPPFNSPLSSNWKPEAKEILVRPWHKGKQRWGNVNLQGQVEDILHVTFSTVSLSSTAKWYSPEGLIEKISNPFL